MAHTHAWHTHGTHMYDSLATYLNFPHHTTGGILVRATLMPYMPDSFTLIEFMYAVLVYSYIHDMKQVHTQL